MSRSTTYLTPGRTARVSWFDAWETERAYTMDELREAHGPLSVVSLGVVVKDDADGITIIACGDEEGTFKRGLFVPRGMIQKVEVLRG